MVIVKPIPPQLLIHTITYEEYLGEAAFGSKYADPLIMTDVLVQPVFKTKRHLEGVDVDIVARIFLDTVNTPMARSLLNRSKITFNGKVLKVVGCSPLYTFDPIVPHHYEVELV